MNIIPPPSGKTQRGKTSNIHNIPTTNIPRLLFLQGLLSKTQGDEPSTHTNGSHNLKYLMNNKNPPTKDPLPTPYRKALTPIEAPKVIPIRKKNPYIFRTLPPSTNLSLVNQESLSHDVFQPKTSCSLSFSGI